MYLLSYSEINQTATLRVAVGLRLSTTLPRTETLPDGYREDSGTGVEIQRERVIY